MASETATVVVTTIAELRRWWDAPGPDAPEEPAAKTLTGAVLELLGEPEPEPSSDLLALAAPRPVTVDWEAAKREWADEVPTKEIPAPLLWSLRGKTSEKGDKL